MTDLGTATQTLIGLGPDAWGWGTDGSTPTCERIR